MRVSGLRAFFCIWSIPVLSLGIVEIEKGCPPWGSGSGSCCAIEVAGRWYCDLLRL